jgi:hypothetical protein
MRFGDLILSESLSRPCFWKIQSESDVEMILSCSKFARILAFGAAQPKVARKTVPVAFCDGLKIAKYSTLCCGHFFHG